MQITAHYVQDGKVYIELRDHTYVWSGATGGNSGHWAAVNGLSGTQESALMHETEMEAEC